MITEEYVSFETAKLLKEKGFREICNHYYNAQYDQIRTVSDTFMMDWNDEDHMRSITMPNAISIPTQQMAMRWLRKVHKIAILPTLFYNKLNGHEFHNWGLDIINLTDYSHLVDYTQTFPSDSYEEAVETGIKYCLENLI